MTLAAGGLIGFREALEAALVVGILLTFLARTDRQALNRWVWAGVAAGVVASIVVAGLFMTLAGGFEGRSEALFEGFLMLFAALMITLLIVWMMGHTQATHELERQAESAMVRSGGLGIGLLVFLSVWREGVETVIFLGAGADGMASVIGALAGIALACGLGALIFWKGRQVDLKLLFRSTTVLLVLFAAGLLAHGIHELQEAGVILIIHEPVWDMNHILDEGSALGSILKGLFGYNGNPSLLEVIAFVAYLAVALTLHLHKQGQLHLRRTPSTQTETSSSSTTSQEQGQRSRM